MSTFGTENNTQDDNSTFLTAVGNYVWNKKGQKGDVGYTEEKYEYNGESKLRTGTAQKTLTGMVTGAEYIEHETFGESFYLKIKSSGESYKNAPDDHSPEPTPTPIAEAPVAEIPAVEEKIVETPVVEASSDVAEVSSDDLKKIGGIGPAFEKRLNAMGIMTYADMAGMTSEKVAALEAEHNDSMTNPEEWTKWSEDAKELMNANN